MSAVTPIITGSGQAPDAELERSLNEEWDAKVINYPNEDFLFDEWILNRIRKMGYTIDSLDYLHESIPVDEVYTVTKQLCADTNLPEFRRLLNRFVRDVIVPQGKLRSPVAVQRYMNVRIMLPTTPDLYFAYHTGLLYGHGIASRSIWLPFCDVTADEDRTRSMQIVPLKESRELIQRAIDEKLSMEEMTELFEKDSRHIKAGPGSCCLFGQQHIHGSGMPNTSGKTRVSMDFRISEGIYGDLLGRKIPAGYFHVIPETEQEEQRLAQLPPREDNFNNGKKNMFYVGNSTASTYAVPVHLQRYMLNDYCQKNAINVDFEVFDLEDMTHFPTLTNVINTRNVNLVMYSIFALPEEESVRNRLLETALEKGNIVHFVNEGLALTNAADLEEIKSYLSFAKYGNSFLPMGLPVSETTRDYFAKWGESLNRGYN